MDTPTVVNNPRGRPSGGSDTYERLVSAARHQFLEFGYEQTSSRAIAREAGVSHAMVNYYFGGKEGLFNVVLDLVISPGQVFDKVAADHTTRDLAPGLLNAALMIWDTPTVQTRLRRLLVDAETNSQARAAFRGYLETEVVGRIAAAIGGPDAHRWASGVAATIAGAFLTRYVLRIEPIAGMSREEVVRFVTPALQAGLTKQRSERNGFVPRTAPLP